MSKIILLLVGLLVTVSVFADTVECNITATARCICPSPILIKCGSVKGNIKSDSSLEYLKITVTGKDGVTREVRLNNPPGGISNYSAVRYNKWVKSKIKRLKSDDLISISENGYGLDSKTALYSDVKALILVGTVGGSSSK